MGAHNDLVEIGRLFELGEALVRNPGSGGTLDLRGMWNATAVLSAGTYKLPNSVYGQKVTVIATGAVTITTANGNSLAVLASGDSCTFNAESTSGSGAWGIAVIKDQSVIVDFGSDYPVMAGETRLQGVLASLIGSAFYEQHIDIPLTLFRETASGDVANAAGNGGLLASDTAPIFEGAGATNAQRLNWATGNVDPVTACISLPSYFDGTQNVTVELIVASAGTTNGWTNASGLITNWDGGAAVTDAIADTAATAVHATSTTITEDGFPDAPLCLSVTITPPTHATDALYLYGCRLKYSAVVHGTV